VLSLIYVYRKDRTIIRYHLLLDHSLNMDAVLLDDYKHGVVLLREGTYYFV
jgi:hypothetical protein